MELHYCLHYFHQVRLSLTGGYENRNQPQPTATNRNQPGCGFYTQYKNRNPLYLTTATSCCGFYTQYKNRNHPYLTTATPLI